MSLLCDILILFVGLFTFASGNSPVFIWTTRNLHMKSPPLGRVIPEDSFKYQFANKIFRALPGTNVALFVHENLSNRDLAAYGGATGNSGVLSNLRRFVSPEYHAIMLDRVQEPLSAFGGVNIIDVPDPAKISDLLELSDPNFVNVFRVDLHNDPLLSHKDSLKKNDAVIGNVMREFQRINHPFVGVLTGKDAPVEPAVHAIKKRQVAVDAPKEVTWDNLWDGNCIIVYAKMIEVTTFNVSDELNKVRLEGKPKITPPKCEGDAKSTISAVYKGTSQGKDYTATIVLTVSNFNSWWSLTGASVKFGEIYSALQIPDGIWASKGFSYHCSALEELKANDTTGFHVTLELKEFQIQGLTNTKNAAIKFGDAFDCAGFFSMPIIIGLLLSLFLAFVVTVGVIAMANIRTPDRFDDPKGETISVPNE